MVEGSIEGSVVNGNGFELCRKTEATWRRPSFVKVQDTV
jgi:hypothetical protein